MENENEIQKQHEFENNQQIQPPQYVIKVSTIDKPTKTILPTSKISLNEDFNVKYLYRLFFQVMNKFDRKEEKKVMLDALKESSHVINIFIKSIRNKRKGKVIALQTRIFL